MAQINRSNDLVAGRNSIRNKMLRVVLPLIVIPFLVAGILDAMIAKQASDEFTKWNQKQKELDILFLSETGTFRGFTRLDAFGGTGMSPPDRTVQDAVRGPVGVIRRVPDPKAHLRESLVKFYEGMNQPFELYRSIRFIASNGTEVAAVEEGLFYENNTDWSGAPIFTTVSQMKPGQIHSTQSDGLMTYATPVYDDFNRDDQYTKDEFRGIILTTFTSSFKQFDEVAWKAAILAISAVCIALIFTGILIARRIHHVTQPIADLVKATRNLSEGTYPDLIAYHGEDEVGILARNFDAMVESLKKRTLERDQVTERLKDLNKNLEQMVMERTRELEKANISLIKASEHKTQFLANMSHELRTPMNAIIGFTELLKDGVYGEISPKIVEIVEKILRNGRHLLAMINDVLDLTKIEAGQMEIHRAAFSAHDLIDTVTANISALAEQKGLSVVKDVAEGIPTAYGDEKRINQVLWNLLSNAIKFTEKGEIGIGVRKQDDMLQFYVSDTGIGIPEDKVDGIFEEFTQADATHTRQYGGTGLGLAIAKKIIHLHGGRIWVESRPGEGSVFHFSLPAEKAGEESSPSENASPKEG